MEREFSFKQLYQVQIKTTQKIEINGINFDQNETIASFDKIQLANFNQIKSFVSANGGFDNRAHVWWETTKEMRLKFSQGIFSKNQFAIMNNTKLIKSVDQQELVIDQEQELESNEQGVIQFKYVPINYLFIYDKNSGEKITDYEIINEKTIQIDISFKQIICRYQWAYIDGFSKFLIGRQLSNGTFVLTGRTKVKDDITGQVKTGIITIPKLKLMSELSMRLGADASPMVGYLDAVAFPIGYKGISKVMDLVVLNDDIDSDL